MATAQASAAQARRAVKLEYFTITWNVMEAMVAIGAGIAAGSIALVGFGFEIEPSIEARKGDCAGHPPRGDQRFRIRVSWESPLRARERHPTRRTRS